MTKKMDKEIGYLQAIKFSKGDRSPLAFRVYTPAPPEGESVAVFQNDNLRNWTEGLGFTWVFRRKYIELVAPNARAGRVFYQKMAEYEGNRY